MSIQTDTCNGAPIIETRKTATRGTPHQTSLPPPSPPPPRPRRIAAIPRATREKMDALRWFPSLPSAISSALDSCRRLLLIGPSSSSSLIPIMSFSNMCEEGCLTNVVDVKLSLLGSTNTTTPQSERSIGASLFDTPDYVNPTTTTYNYNTTTGSNNKDSHVSTGGMPSLAFRTAYRVFEANAVTPHDGLDDQFFLASARLKQQADKCAKEWSRRIAYCMSSSFSSYYPSSSSTAKGGNDGVSTTATSSFSSSLGAVARTCTRAVAVLEAWAELVTKDEKQNTLYFPIGNTGSSSGGHDELTIKRRLLILRRELDLTNDGLPNPKIDPTNNTCTSKNNEAIINNGIGRDHSISIGGSNPHSRPADARWGQGEVVVSDPAAIAAFLSSSYTSSSTKTAAANTLVCLFFSVTVHLDGVLCQSAVWAKQFEAMGAASNPFLGCFLLPPQDLQLQHHQRNERNSSEGGTHNTTASSSSGNLLTSASTVVSLLEDLRGQSLDPLARCVIDVMMYSSPSSSSVSSRSDCLPSGPPSQFNAAARTTAMMTTQMCINFTDFADNSFLNFCFPPSRINVNQDQRQREQASLGGFLKNLVEACFPSLLSQKSIRATRGPESDENGPIRVRETTIDLPIEEGEELHLSRVLHHDDDDACSNSTSTCTSPPQVDTAARERPPQTELTHPASHLRLRIITVEAIVPRDLVELLSLREEWSSSSSVRGVRVGPFDSSYRANSTISRADVGAMASLVLGTSHTLVASSSVVDEEEKEGHYMYEENDGGEESETATRAEGRGSGGGVHLAPSSTQSDMTADSTLLATRTRQATLFRQALLSSLSEMTAKYREGIDRRLRRVVKRAKRKLVSSSSSPHPTSSGMQRPVAAAALISQINQQIGSNKGHALGRSEDSKANGLKAVVDGHHIRRVTKTNATKRGREEASADCSEVDVDVSDGSLAMLGGGGALRGDLTSTESLGRRKGMSRNILGRRCDDIVYDEVDDDDDVYDNSSALSSDGVSAEKVSPCGGPSHSSALCGVTAAGIAVPLLTAIVCCEPNRAAGWQNGGETDDTCSKGATHGKGTHSLLSGIGRIANNGDKRAGGKNSLSHRMAALRHGREAVASVFAALSWPLPTYFYTSRAEANSKAFLQSVHANTHSHACREGISQQFSSSMGLSSSLSPIYSCSTSRTHCPPSTAVTASTPPQPNVAYLSPLSVTLAMTYGNLDFGLGGAPTSTVACKDSGEKGAMSISSSNWGGEAASAAHKEVRVTPEGGSPLIRGALISSSNEAGGGHTSKVDSLVRLLKFADGDGANSDNYMYHNRGRGRSWGPRGGGRGIGKTEEGSRLCSSTYNRGQSSVYHHNAATTAAAAANSWAPPHKSPFFTTPPPPPTLLVPVVHNTDTSGNYRLHAAAPHSNTRQRQDASVTNSEKKVHSSFELKQSTSSPPQRSTAVPSVKRTLLVFKKPGTPQQFKSGATGDSSTNTCAPASHSSAPKLLASGKPSEPLLLSINKSRQSSEGPPVHTSSCPTTNASPPSPSPSATTVDNMHSQRATAHSATTTISRIEAFKKRLLLNLPPSTANNTDTHLTSALYVNVTGGGAGGDERHSNSCYDLENDRNGAAGHSDAFEDSMYGDGIPAAGGGGGGVPSPIFSRERGMVGHRAVLFRDPTLCIPSCPSSSYGFSDGRRWSRDIPEGNEQEQYNQNEVSIDFSYTLGGSSSALVSKKTANRGVPGDQLLSLSKYDFTKGEVIGQWERKFILVSVPLVATRGYKAPEPPRPTPDALSSVVVAIDQHALHERIRLEAFLANMEQYVSPTSILHSFADHRNRKSQRTSNDECSGGAKYRGDPPFVTHDGPAVEMFQPLFLTSASMRRYMHGIPLPIEKTLAVLGAVKGLNYWGWRVVAGHSLENSATHVPLLMSSSSSVSSSPMLRLYLTHVPTVRIEGFSYTLSGLTPLWDAVEDLRSCGFAASGTVEHDCRPYTEDVTNEEDEEEQKRSRGGAAAYQKSGVALQKKQECSSFPFPIPRSIHSAAVLRSCRGAIMFNDVLDAKACTMLIRTIPLLDLYKVCSHGRVSMVTLTDIVSSRK